MLQIQRRDGVASQLNMAPVQGCTLDPEQRDLHGDVHFEGNKLCETEGYFAGKSGAI